MDLLQELKIPCLKHNQIDPNQCLELVKHFLRHSGRWKPGAPYKRILNAHLEMPIEEGWPSDSPEWTRKQKFKSSQHRFHKENENELQQKRSRDDEIQNAKAKRKQLEKEFGPLLDSLNPDDKLALAAQCSKIVLSQFRRHGVSDAGLRIKLLEQLCLSGSTDEILSKVDQVPEDLGT